MAKMDKKQRKFLIRRLLIVAVALAFLVYFGVRVISTSVDIHTQRQSLEQAQLRVERQRQLNEELSRLVDSGDIDAQMERVARDKLGYAKPGERIYIPVN